MTAQVVDLCGEAPLPLPRPAPCAPPPNPHATCRPCHPGRVGDCDDNGLAVAIPALANLTGRDPNANPSIEVRRAGRRAGGGACWPPRACLPHHPCLAPLQVSWDWVDCAPFIGNGTIKMLLKPGGK